MHSALQDLINYLASTYSDKYASPAAMFNTKDALYNIVHGKSINAFQAGKYLTRYATTGYSKSENVVDLYKACHYVLFELVRRRILSDDQRPNSPGESS